MSQQNKTLSFGLKYKFLIFWRQHHNYSVIVMIPRVTTHWYLVLSSENKASHTVNICVVVITTLILSVVFRCLSVKCKCIKFPLQEQRFI